jgi:hypothetical protein
MIQILTYGFQDDGCVCKFKLIKQNFGGFRIFGSGFSTDVGWFSRTSDGFKIGFGFLTGLM